MVPKIHQDDQNMPTTIHCLYQLQWHHCNLFWASPLWKKGQSLPRHVQAMADYWEVRFFHDEFSKTQVHVFIFWKLKKAG